MSRHQSQASRRRLIPVNEEETPPMMYTEKSQTLMGQAGDDGCEELKVEEEKNDFFDYQFHPVPQEQVEGSIVATSTTFIENSHKVEIN